MKRIRSVPVGQLEASLMSVPGEIPAIIQRE